MRSLKRRETGYHVVTHELSESLRGLLEQLIEAVGEGDMNPKLDTVIEMLKPLASVPADIALVKEELSLVHGLVADLSTDPDKLRQLTEQLKSSTDALDAAVQANKPQQQ